MSADRRPPLPRQFLPPCILLLLRESPAHGYDLLERLTAFGLGQDPGGLYRALRTLESDGLVHSSWSPSSVGPDRRTYEITRPGMEALHAYAKGLERTAELVGGFLSRYGEFVSLTPVHAERQA